MLPAATFIVASGLMMTFGGIPPPDPREWRERRPQQKLPEISTARLLSQKLMLQKPKLLAASAK